MNTIHSHRHDGTGFELWQTMDGGYRLRTWHQSPSGTLAAPHSVTLTEADLDQLVENIMEFLANEMAFEEEVEDLIHDMRGQT